MALSEKDQVGALKEMSAMKDSAFIRYLKSELEIATLEMGTCSDEIHLRWMQGKSQLFRSLISEIEGSRDKLEKWDRPRVDMSKAY